jgi:hypothetical protein
VAVVAYTDDFDALVSCDNCIQDLNGSDVFIQCVRHNKEKCAGAPSCSSYTVPMTPLSELWN